jgi:hypothetical protein
MKQNYFVANGVKYYTGTIFIVNDMGNIREASFLYYDTECSRYIYKITDCVYNTDAKNFNRIFISTTGRIDNKIHAPTTKTKKDMEIDGLFLGWVWYIFLMAISSIFKDVIGLWILISIVFFYWRKNKIKEEGTYVEW